MEASWGAAAYEIITREAGPLETTNRFHTWGPTIVFGAQPMTGPPVVLKASELQNVAIEAATCTRAGKAGIPTPEVLAEGFDQRLPGGRWFLMRRIPGKRWTDVTFDRQGDLAVLEQLAACFRTLHAIRLPGFGRLTEAGGGERASWAEWLADGFRASADPLIARGHLTAEFHQLVGDVLDAMAPLLASRPGALIHGDLGDGEVYVDPETRKITELVDWGAAVVGDPLYEFARFVAGGPVDDPRPEAYRPALLDFYGGRQGWWSGLGRIDAEALAELYDAYNAIDNAHWSLVEGYDWMDSLCAKGLGLLRDLR
ncbi:phosphotransferase family protein [Flindersiella endophytica]